MTVDVFFSTIAKVAGWCLPVLGIVVLVYVILVLKELLQTVKNATKMLETSEQQIRKLDAPLSTAESISHTVDEVHETTKKAVKTAAGAIAKNVDQIKNWVNAKKTNTEDITDGRPSDEIQKEEES